jgi:hypothetical protein
MSTADLLEITAFSFIFSFDAIRYELWIGVQCYVAMKAFSIVKLGSEIEDADTTNSIKLKSKNKTKEQEEKGT